MLTYESEGESFIKLYNKLEDEWDKIKGRANTSVQGASVAILGFTFKENCPDPRNTKIIDIVKELKEYGIEPLLADPVADEREANLTYGVHFTDLEEIRDMDAVILAVAHEEYQHLKQKDLDRLYRSNITKVLIDVKSVLNRKEYENAGYVYWRL